MIVVKGFCPVMPRLEHMNAQCETSLAHSDPALARRVIALLDLTELDDSADAARIQAVCRAARSEHGPVAAVCIPPAHIAVARAALLACDAAMVKVATVANFPAGEASAAQAAQQTAHAVAAGADEVDVVFPWKALICGNERLGHNLVLACKAACGSRVGLKVILESGMLHSHVLIRRASEIALAAGADFIKTSTGRTAHGASLDAAAVMLEVIAEHHGEAGLKVSGGIRTLADAAGYLALADHRMGREWTTPERFRIGASRLLDEALAALERPAS